MGRKAGQLQARPPRVGSDSGKGLDPRGSHGLRPFTGDPELTSPADQERRPDGARLCAASP